MPDIKNFRANLLIGILLIISSSLLYSIQIYIFNSPRDTFYYLFQDLAFVPLQVIIVTLVLDKLLTAREKQEKLLKLNIIISAFFSELGAEAISRMTSSNLNLSALEVGLRVDSGWNEAEFKKASNIVKGFKFQVESTSIQLVSMREFLHANKPYLLRMFDNPNLLEHDAFTEMLWALLHVTEELESRESLEGLPKNDIAHLSNDVMRAYRFLTIEWVCYMKYLKKDYPYLFSLATRKNPYKGKSSVIIE
ncbi:hypothetical protein UF75_2895 [Desulfosporosinus sp. I2]|nr:hypothetical protein UF75_2895 [Desulfosporosinus sp. I2]